MGDEVMRKEYKESGQRFAVCRVQWEERKSEMNHEIRLYGPIGGFFGFTANEILAGIPEEAKAVTVRIHSPGGSVGEGIAIYHALRNHPAKVTTVVDGYAASTASFVMLAGDERLVHRNSIVFVHNPWTNAEGNAEELRKVADGLDVHAEAMLDIYKQRTGMGESELRDMLDETAFFRGVDAAGYGFATAVIDEPEAEAQIAAMLKFEGIAAQAKEEQMSRQKTRKELEEALAAKSEEMQGVLDEVTGFKTKLDESIAESEGVVAERDALTEQVGTLGGRVEELEAKITEINAEHEERVLALVKEVDEAKGQVESVTVELDAAKARLSDPAFEDAAAKEAAEAAQAALDAEADAAEKEAQAKAEKEAQANAPSYEKWKAIEDARERRAYYLEHEAAIKADWDKINSEETEDK